MKSHFSRSLWEDPNYAEPRIASTPLKSFGKPEDISGAEVYLASNAGGWITGQTIVIDGGVTITV